MIRVLAVLLISLAVEDSGGCGCAHARGYPPTDEILRVHFPAGSRASPWWTCAPAKDSPTLAQVNCAPGYETMVEILARMSEDGLAAVLDDVEEVRQELRGQKQ